MNEGVNLEEKRREREAQHGTDIFFAGRGDEVEEDALRAVGVLEDGMDGCHGATQVGPIEGHGDVYERGVACWSDGQLLRAAISISELLGLGKELLLASMDDRECSGGRCGCAEEDDDQGDEQEREIHGGSLEFSESAFRFMQGSGDLVGRG